MLQSLIKIAFVYLSGLGKILVHPEMTGVQKMGSKVVFTVSFVIQVIANTILVWLLAGVIFWILIQAGLF